MCLASPARVVEVGPGVALVERGGERFPALTHLLDADPAPGDWVAVQARRQAVARLTEAEAREMEGLYALIDAALDPATEDRP
jgi:hydrogenase maturation factor